MQEKRHHAGAERSLPDTDLAEAKTKAKRISGSALWSALSNGEISAQYYANLKGVSSSRDWVVFCRLDDGNVSVAIIYPAEHYSQEFIKSIVGWGEAAGLSAFRGAGVDIFKACQLVRARIDEAVQEYPVYLKDKKAE